MQMSSVVYLRNKNTACLAGMRRELHENGVEIEAAVYWNMQAVFKIWIGLDNPKRSGKPFKVVCFF